MIWAIVKNDKIKPIPKSFGTCPLCERTVLSKCGKVNAWHWAHVNDESCDHWAEPETYWHLHWKMTFGKENAEIVINKNGKKHIADVLTKNKVVIELQNSPIPKPIIRKREDFYGERMLWLINGKKFAPNFNHNLGADNLTYEFSRQWDVEAGRRKERDIDFEWKHARRSWSEVRRNVFIDFGDSTLFWVLKGMGTSSGMGVYISKKKFIKKYGGNYDYYCQHDPDFHGTME